MKKCKIIISIFLVLFILVSVVFVAFAINIAQKKETLKEPIDNGMYTIYPRFYKEGLSTYVTFSVKNKDDKVIIPEENRWLLREFYEIGFGPLHNGEEVYVYVICRDTETLFGKCSVMFKIKGKSADDVTK